MEPPDPARAAGGRACSPSQVGPRRTPARALAEPSRPAETWLRAGRLARELRSRAPPSLREGKRTGPGRCSGMGVGCWECERTATSALTAPAAGSSRGKKLCLEERFAREPARAQLSCRRWRAWTGGARGHGGARVLGAGRCAWYSPWGAAPWSPPRGLVCGVWVTPATDVSCFSDPGCIFVGSAVIWGAGWRRWAWNGEGHI